MTKEETEELKMLSEKLHRLDGGKGIAFPKTIEQADTLIGLIARFNYLQGKKEEHDKIVEVISMLEDSILLDLNSHGYIMLVDKILEKLQS